VSRTDQYVISLTRVRDKKDFGKWQTYTGGGTDSSEVTTRDGFGLPRKQLGSQPTNESVSCSRVFYPETDDGELGELKEGVGKDLFIANKQKLDVDGHTVGAPDAKTCMLKSCKPSDVNVADDTPSADTYTIELSPEGP
jgi:hypothetical protein